MAGPFDNFFGGGGAAAGNMFGGNMYGDLLTPEQLAAVRRQSMMQVAAKLLESSGPSTTRRTLGQTLGGALSAGAEAMQSGQTNAVQQMLLKQKLDEAKQKAAQLKQWNETFAPASNAIPAQQVSPLTPAQALLAPTGGRAGPTPQNAAMIGTVPPVTQTAVSQGASPIQDAIRGLNLNPAQLAFLQQSGPSEGFSQLNTMMSQATRKMTSQELAAYGLPPNTSATIDGTGKVSILQAPRLQIYTAPDGSTKIINLDETYQGAITPSSDPLAAAPSTTAAPATAPSATAAPPAAPTAAKPPAANRQGVANLFPASLNPNEINATAERWDTKMYSPVSAVVQNFEVVKELLQSGQGGISDYGVLIKSIKALEPTSAVMQGEADSAKSMMSLANRMEALMGQVERGGMGSDAARLQLAELARSATLVAVNTYNKQLARQRQIYGNAIPASTVDAILAEIPMPQGAESSDALRSLIAPQLQSGGQGGQPQMVFNPGTNRWERR
jgi:hypothetical protein